MRHKTAVTNIAETQSQPLCLLQIKFDRLQLKPSLIFEVR